MGFQRGGIVGLVALSYALTLGSSGVLATSSATLSASGCIDTYVADGDCDLVNNNADCEFDGGDCCECTCVSTLDYTCGENGGFSCLDPNALCVNDDDVTTLPSSERFCINEFVGDGDCDESNNFEACGYDGGDCCECTCVSTDQFNCGDEDNGGFACIDPTAPCLDDINDDDVKIDDDDAKFGDDDMFGDDAIFDDDMSASFDFDYSFGMPDMPEDIPDMPEDIPDSPESFSYSSCIDAYIGDGECDMTNNTEECGYDGGDCCECTCISGLFSICGENAEFDCIDPNASCVNGYVEAGTKTNVFVSTNAYDTRPGQVGGGGGCMVDGCAPALTRDGVTADVQSRWSCNPSIVADGGLCEIEFVFEAPQDVMSVQVAFWMGDERTRTLEATIDGVVIGEFDSYPGSVFNTFEIKGTNVHTVKLTSTGITQSEWISLLEVRLLVAP